MQLALVILDLVVKYGVPAVKQIVEDWGVENPTAEDIEDLKNRVPKPGTYFEEGGS